MYKHFLKHFSKHRKFQHLSQTMSSTDKVWLCLLVKLACMAYSELAKKHSVSTFLAMKTVMFSAGDATWPLVSESKWFSLEQTIAGVPFTSSNW